MDRLEVTKDILGHWLSQDKKKLGWWVDLVFLSDSQGVVHMNLTDLARRWESNKMTVSRFLDKLSGETICDTKVLRKAGVITVIQSRTCEGCENEVCYGSVTEQERSLISLSPTPPISFNPKEISTSTAPAYVHTREDEFVRRYRDEGMWMDVALILHVRSLEKCQSLFNDFVTEYQHKGDAHRDYTDFKKHFIQWARIAIQKENSNGSSNNSGQDKRRGVQVVANSIEDYQGPF